MLKNSNFLGFLVLSDEISSIWNSERTERGLSLAEFTNFFTFLVFNYNSKWLRFLIRGSS